MCCRYRSARRLLDSTYPLERASAAKRLLGVPGCRCRLKRREGGRHTRRENGQELGGGGSTNLVHDRVERAAGHGGCVFIGLTELMTSYRRRALFTVMLL